MDPFHSPEWFSINARILLTFEPAMVRGDVHLLTFMLQVPPQLQPQLQLLPLQRLVQLQQHLQPHLLEPQVSCS